MTEERLAALEALCLNAFEGPWSTTPDVNCDVYGAVGEWLAETDDDDNAAFIAESRTALPELVAEVRRLRGALEDIADSPHQQYASATPIGIGIADGHRCAANMARHALGREEEE